MEKQYYCCVETKYYKDANASMDISCYNANDEEVCFASYMYTSLIPVSFMAKQVFAFAESCDNEWGVNTIYINKEDCALMYELVRYNKNYNKDLIITTKTKNENTGLIKPCLAIVGTPLTDNEYCLPDDKLSQLFERDEDKDGIKKMFDELIEAINHLTIAEINPELMCKMINDQTKATGVIKICYKE